MYVSLLLDAEDFIGPHEAEAVREIADVLTEVGLRATFCIVGELARRFEREGRSDVVRALEPHDIGLHTDMHSVHPTTCEELEHLDWHRGVEAMVRANAPGVSAIRRVFGRAASCWGGAGNTWGPQVCGALRELGIPAIVYAHTSPLGSDLHEYRGLTAFGAGLHLGDASLARESASRSKLAELHRNLTFRVNEGVEWCEVFVGHPCVFRCMEFWDALNFAAGRNPPRDAWRPATLRSESEYRLMLVRLRRALESLAARSELRFVTIGEMTELALAAEKESLGLVEREEWKRAVTERLSAMKAWPIHRPNLDVSALTELAIEGVDSVRRLRLGPRRGAA